MSDSPETLDHRFERVLSAAQDTTTTDGAYFSDRPDFATDDEELDTLHRLDAPDGGPCIYCEQRRAAAARRPL